MRRHPQFRLPRHPPPDATLVATLQEAAEPGPNAQPQKLDSGAQDSVQSLASSPANATETATPAFDWTAVRKVLSSSVANEEVADFVGEEGLALAPDEEAALFGKVEISEGTWPQIGDYLYRQAESLVPIQNSGPATSVPVSDVPTELGTPLDAPVTTATAPITFTPPTEKVETGVADEAFGALMNSVAASATAASLTELPTDETAPIVSAQVTRHAAASKVETTSAQEVLTRNADVPTVRATNIGTKSEATETESSVLQVSAADPDAEISQAAATRKEASSGDEGSDQSSDSGQGNESPFESSNSVFAVDAPESNPNVRETKMDAKALTPSESRMQEGILRREAVRQVADQLEVMAATRPREAVVVRLEPADLGTVTMTILQRGSLVEAHISASEERVRTALEQSRPDLAATMQQRGVSIQSFSITAPAATEQSSSDFFGQNMSQSGQAFQQHQPPSRGGYDTPRVFAEEAKLDASTLRRGSANERGVDLIL